ncbi:hypothetical protein G5714_008751 [Onychostoma macrolepis]|uniref:Ig-like domain-containing protein n=1 Tax=Onychostoma macrolepis TaxID=369639 RepID=A0A7J6CWU4_9TELE|nr:hypothetical protein G5714_008751 [Onychostoma macrolepis]
MLLIIITLLVNLFIETSESFTVVVPGDPVEAHVGSSVILSCWISPPENAEALEIRWYRHDFNNPVLLYNHGKIQDIQDELYRKRSSLSLRSDQSGGLKDGDVSLRLEKLRVQDDGSFRCYVSGENAYGSEEVLLKIMALGSTPVLVPQPLDDERMNISCRSSGWHPKPSVTWTSDDGGVLRPGGSSHSREEDRMFSVHSWIAISRSDAQLVSCSLSIGTGEFKESRIDVQAFFSSGPWKALFFTFLVFTLLGLVGLILYRYRHKLTGKKAADENGPNGFHTNTDPPVKLSLTPRPERLGVLLDYDDGQLSFYNVTERKHLLTISSRFSGSVVPLFNPGAGDESPLTILDCPEPVESAAESIQPFLSNNSSDV